MLGSCGLLALYAITVWWFATGLILYLDGLPEHTYRWSLLGAAALCVVALAGIVMTRETADFMGALVGFTAAIVLWGFNELAFLTGYVVGPVREPCPQECSGWQRFRLASAAIAYHEIALLVTMAVIGWLVLGSANAAALWTFALLWAMRLSTKINIFLGVSNVTEEFMPERIAYLKSYFRKAPMNMFFPVSVTLATGITLLLGQRALATTATEFEMASGTLLATFSLLAVLEHWFLVVPLPVAGLWAWGLASHASASNTGAVTRTDAEPLAKHRGQPRHSTHGRHSADRPAPEVVAAIRQRSIGSLKIVPAIDRR